MYHRIKEHWNCYDLCSDVSNDKIKKLFDYSCQFVSSELMKKLQTEIRVLEDKVAKKSISFVK